MNGLAPPFYSKGSAGYQQEDAMMIWDATQMLNEGLNAHRNDLPRMLELAHNLRQVLENTRSMYNTALSERDRAYHKLQEADNKLLQVENVVRRYALVQEPVVASDGYTYERAALKQYLDDCTSTNSKAYSQQTKEELLDVLVPNSSLKRLVDLLKGIRTTEVPQMVHRAPITALGGGGSGQGPRAVNAWGDEETAVPAATPVRVGEAAATAGAPVGAGPGSAGSRSHNQPAAVAHRGRGLEGGKAGGSNRQGGGGGGSGSAKPPLHPCLRVYGYCNFMEDCTFANYPYEACLNHIKGKCRFGLNCKELHVEARDARYQNARSNAIGHGHYNNNHNNSQKQASDDAPTKPAGEAAAASSSTPSTIETPATTTQTATTAPKAAGSDAVTAAATAAPEAAPAVLAPEAEGEEVAKATA